jgi:hypothetical protein
VGHPGAPQDRPHRLSVAHPAVHRPDAEILYVPTDQVLAVQADQDAMGFDTPGARYDHRDGMCTFEVLIEEYGLGGDPALARLATIVHAADIDGEVHTDPFAPALLALAVGGLDVEADDHRLLDGASFVHDALYDWCQRDVNVGAPA